MPRQPSLLPPPEVATPEPVAHPHAVRAGERLSERLVVALERALVLATPRSYRAAFGALAAVLGTLFALILIRGPVVQTYYAHDDMNFLAFAWRIRQGIFPCADYHIALGPLNAWIHAAGMWLLGPTATVLSFCNGLVAVGIGWLAWTVAARRLPAVLAGAFAFTQAVVAMSPHLMRFEWTASTYDCYYNRQDFAILAVVMLAVFLPRTGPRDLRAERRDERTLGVILGALLFLKITFFMAACGFYGLACITARQPRRLASRHLFGAFLVTVLLCLPTIRFDLLAMFADLGFAARARTANPDAAVTVSKIIWWTRDASLEIGLLAVAQIASRATPTFRRWDRQTNAATAPSWLEYASVIGMTVLLNITNAGGGPFSETPLLTSWMFVLAGYAVRMQGDARAGARPLRQPDWAVVLACMVGGMLWVHTFGASLRCLCWSTWPWPSPTVQRLLANAPVFETPSLTPLRISGNGGEAILKVTYAEKINDGMKLLRRLGGVHRVGTIDFNNPFPFAMLWPPPQGDFWAWHYGYSFGETARPTFDEAFGDADVLMVPKFAGEPTTVAAMKRMYKEDLEQRFIPAMESDQYYLLVRR